MEVWSASRPAGFTREESVPATRWISGPVGPRSGLEAVDKKKSVHLQGTEFLFTGDPVTMLTELFGFRIYADMAKQSVQLLVAKRTRNSEVFL
jgi:hypothetical protein